RSYGDWSSDVCSSDLVVVDYIGDELMAMWGAPGEQADHARLACLAARDMLARLPQMNERWKSLLEEPMGLGVGINTGPARVGNKIGRASCREREESAV